MKPISAACLAWALFMIALPGCSSSGDSSSQQGSSQLDRCGIWGHACCEGSQCGPGLQCEVDRCVQGRQSVYNKGCSEDADCPGAVCSHRRCAFTCHDSSQCPRATQCLMMEEDDNSKVCEWCSGGIDSCDGQDSNCDGIVDNQGQADLDCTRGHGQGYICRQGQCTCPGTCDGKCTNLLGDPKNCGACGKACGDKEFCNEGGCESLLSKMIQIPGGTFQMGADDLDDASPVHSVTVSSFWLDETEVTEQAYLACVKAGACKPQDGHMCTSELNPHRAVNCINWDRAKAFCEWAGKKLPTEAQWEYAARHGSDNWRYPWGNQEPTNEKLCWKSQELQGCEVGSHGAYGFGLRDMAGNMAEWVADDFALYLSEPQTDPFYESNEEPRRHIVRGGDYGANQGKYVRAEGRQSSMIQTSLAGFRCAK